MLIGTQGLHTSCKVSTSIRPVCEVADIWFSDGR